ncbi:flagellar basal body rod protein FlgC [Halothermothrix orenii]|uniref:Flagellar basal-body rod protein FlgC n=1 Tax=Halothermothrix orenii (strain H 168 / OCM 544 / DSM 9562) TaxID=373903 RepID=B8CYS1_HALOH|nr:flagellar basal body rod protein FlgC [Halothermothrix orenii]ACL70440.1 flagellar basal-body rod protein FlgC [Halothermothrix orenii H 168]
MLDSLNISASGLTAQRLRMDIIADNIANVNTTRTEDGGPYRRKLPVFREREADSFARVFQSKLGKDTDRRGVEVVGIREDDSPFKMVYNPGHPDANEEGYVAMPNVNITTEMVDMISASRAYEANVTALNTAKNMALKALQIGQG